MKTDEDSQLNQEMPNIAINIIIVVCVYLIVFDTYAYIHILVMEFFSIWLRFHCSGWDRDIEIGSSLAWTTVFNKTRRARTTVFMPILSCLSFARHASGTRRHA